MEVRIGVVYTTRELTIETDDSPEAVIAAIDGAVGKSDTLLWLTDSKGRRVGVPVDAGIAGFALGTGFALVLRRVQLGAVQFVEGVAASSVEYESVGEQG